jgi:hypothetical protein
MPRSGPRGAPSVVPRPGVARTRHEVSVAPPYRLDLTVSVLRRSSTNLVDVLTTDGSYVRVIRVRRLAGAVGRLLRIGASPGRWSSPDAAGLVSALGARPGVDVRFAGGPALSRPGAAPAPSGRP